MEAINKETEIHHGRNIKMARGWRGVTQEWLADEIRVSQKQISTFESQQTVEDEWLDKIASSLDISVDFLKTFHLDEAGKNYYANENSFANNSAENSQESVTQQIVGEQDQNQLKNTSAERSSEIVTQNVSEQNNTVNHTYPIDEIKDLYSKLLEEKDKQIARFEKHVDNLEKQIAELKQNMK